MDERSWDDALVDVVVDFTEAAVHTLLHARRVYPIGPILKYLIEYYCCELLNPNTATIYSVVRVNVISCSLL